MCIEIGHFDGGFGCSDGGRSVGDGPDWPQLSDGSKIGFGWVNTGFGSSTGPVGRSAG
jgi:hypothetical protein